MTVKLTDEKRDALKQLVGGPRYGYGSKSRRILVSLEREGLVTIWDADYQLWSAITPAGHAALLSPEAPASSKEEGE